MGEKKKHKVMIGIEVILLGMIIAIVGTNAASSNPPSNGVSYSKNSQTTVEGALNDLYTKANYGNASAGQILSGKTALVGGKKVTGTMPNKGAVTKTVSPGETYTIPAGYHNGSGKVSASTCPSCSSCCPTCPTCNAGLSSSTTVTTVSYTKNMTLDAGNSYLLCAGGWRSGGDAPTIKIVYSNAANVHEIYSWNAGGGIPSTGDGYIYYHVNKCQIVYIKAAVTLQLNISNNFGNTSRIVKKFS